MDIANQVMAVTARTDVTNALKALASTSVGAARPATPYTGQLWIDNDTPSATNWTLFMFDGVADIALGTIDTTADTFIATNGVKTNVTPNFTVAINEAAYADVASAGTADIGVAASNNVRITGTTTITSLGTAAAGITRRVRFAGALTLTYNAVSLILPTSASIVTAADDMAEFTSLGSGNWICTSFTRKSGAALSAGAAKLVQRAYASLATVQTGTTTTPNDDTIPQNTEGTEFLTLAITPTSATNRLRISGTFHLACTSSLARLIIALHQDTTADAIFAASGNTQTSIMMTFRFEFEMVSGTTAPTTFKVRIGPSTASTVTVNGEIGARKLGGVLISSIIIDEIVP